MALMRTLERRYHEGSGERHLKTDPTKVRCQGVSKTRLRLIRAREKDPDLTADDCWPEAQCSHGALPGLYGCKLHAGSNNTQKYGMMDYVPIDLSEKIAIFHANSDEIINRTHEIAFLKARTAELEESREDLILGEEAWMAVSEAIGHLKDGEVQAALIILESALNSYRTDKEIKAEERANIALIDQLTKTHMTIMEKMKQMATLDQVRQLIEGMYKGSELILEEFIPDQDRRGMALRRYADMLRSLTVLKKEAMLPDGKSS